MQTIIPVILSGGCGTRLWPLSQEGIPKQFNDEILSPSLFIRTHTLVSSKEFTKPVIVSNIRHQFLIEDALLQEYDTMLLEPHSKNTAPAILAASIFIREKYGNNATILVLPSDHLISNQQKFIQSVINGVELAQNNIVTFGVRPSHPETGYGYIEVENSSTGLFKVKKFKEKPDMQTALEFVTHGNFYWNAGIFLFNVDVYLQACKNFIPETFKIVEQSFKGAQIDGKKVELSSLFAGVKSESIDYAIMEKSSNVYLTEMLSSWVDLGSFESLYNVISKDANQNVIRGNIQTMETSGCFIQNNTENLLTTYGIKDSIIVQTANSTLVAPLCCSQNIKNLVGLQDANHKIEPTKTRRPWGVYEIIQKGVGFKVKRIIVNAKKSLSLQSHEYRAESWVVVRGTATVICGDNTQNLTVGHSIFIPAKTKHRLQNLTELEVEIIEVQTGDYLEEDDITRY